MTDKNTIVEFLRQKAREGDFTHERIYFGEAADMIEGMPDQLANKQKSAQDDTASTQP